MTGLEILEEIKDELYNFKDISEYSKNQFSTIEKELRALEIMKKKKVNVVIVLYSKNLEEYNSTVGFYFSKNQLTQDEYDLLKEVLLWVKV